jgi:uncharacterized protein
MSSVLLVPGLWNSGPDHWQSHWEHRYGYERVLQRDWDHPVCADWIATLETAVSAANARPGASRLVLAGHSLGCATIAFWADRFLNARTHRPPGEAVPIAGALLVAPSDPEEASYPKEPVGFSPMPRQVLPFPTIVVASSDDPYVTMDRAKAFADSWGSRFESAGAHGHLNSDSRLGDWPFGHALLREILEGDPG